MIIPGRKFVGGCFPMGHDVCFPCEEFGTKWWFVPLINVPRKCPWKFTPLGCGYDSQVEVIWKKQIWIRDDIQLLEMFIIKHWPFLSKFASLGCLTYMDTWKKQWKRFIFVNPLEDSFRSLASNPERMQPRSCKYPIRLTGKLSASCRKISEVLVVWCWLEFTWHASSLKKKTSHKPDRIAPVWIYIYPPTPCSC